MPEKNTNEKGLAKGSPKTLAKTASKNKRPRKRGRGSQGGRKKGGPTLRIIPLGGLDAIGKNMTAFECGGDIILVDAGLMFPDDEHTGVDLILPD